MLNSKSPNQIKAGKRNARWTMGFMTAYIAASFLDLATTDLALTLNHAAREGNIAATSDGAYDVLKAVLITLGGGVVLGGMFWSGLRSARRVGETWLNNPRRAMMRVTLIPGFERDRSRRPLTLITYAVAFVILRVAAASNNAMIAFGVTGWIATIVNRLAHIVPPLAATILTVCGLYWLIAWTIAPLCATLLRHARGLPEARRAGVEA